MYRSRALTTGALFLYVRFASHHGLARHIHHTSQQGGHRLNERKVEELELLREQVQTHQGVIENHEARLKELETGHSVLRDEQDDFNKKMEAMERNQLELKNVIYSENRETRETMRGTTEKLFLLIEQMTGQKQASTALEYDYRKAQLDVTDKKSQRFWEWFGKAAGAGGIIALVVTGILQFLGQ